MKIGQSTLRRITFVFLLLLMLGILALFIFYNPREMILRIGVRNTFLVTFIVSMVGAFTSLTKFSAYPMVIALVAGQIHPLVAGTVAGLGLASGDLLFFLFGHSAKDLTTEKGQRIQDRILKKLEGMRSLYVQGLIFLYMGVSPFPNNLLSGALAFTGYPFRKVVAPLILGDVTFCILVAWLAYHGVSIV